MALPPYQNKACLPSPCVSDALFPSRAPSPPSARPHGAGHSSFIHAGGSQRLLKCGILTTLTKQRPAYAKTAIPIDLAPPPSPASPSPLHSLRSLPPLLTFRVVSDAAVFSPLGCTEYPLCALVLVILAPQVDEKATCGRRRIRHFILQGVVYTS